MHTSARLPLREGSTWAGSSLFQALKPHICHNLLSLHPYLSVMGKAVTAFLIHLWWFVTAPGTSCIYRANWDCVLSEDEGLPALHFLWQFTDWTSNICAWGFLLMESEAELWAAGALRVLQITDPLHSLFFLNHLSSRLKNRTNVDYPPAEEAFTFSWYKSEQLQRRLFLS